MESDEVINLVDPIFQTKVKCSCTEDDFYPAENLVSYKKGAPNRGFMPYSVVKPPIDLEFKLSCCIELMSIKIWPQIDSLKSIGFEIHANGDENQMEFRKIASHFNLKENGIQFVNNSMGESQTCDFNFAVIPFYSSTRNQLRKIKNIKLIIKQTTRCVPVIKQIEIWGKISKFATSEQKQFVQRAITKAANETNSENSEENDAKSSSQADTVVCESSSIPEDFLDAITYEIMALPMALPSGKCIDNSTLLKHTEHEEKWGRVASDPFTGRPFTDNRKPVLNIHLKSQIDSFLLKNCNVPELSVLPRTIGTISKRRLEPNTELQADHSKIIKTHSSANNCTSQASSSASCKNAPNMQNGPSSSSSFSDTLPRVMATLSTPSPSSPSATRANTRTSLDEAVRSVLKIGKYTTVTKTQSDSNLNKCFQCCDAVNNLLYTIATCSHLICRQCLVGKNLNICKCGQVFSNIDVNKYNFKNLL